jgi:ribosomal protein S18 acetylase RimI-like enzyme
MTIVTPATSIHIRSLHESDKPAIVSIGRHVFREEDEIPLLHKALQQCVPHVSLVAVDDNNTVLGFTLVCKTITKEYYQFLRTIPSSYELAFLGISPCSQGRGVGSRLLKETLQAIFQVSHHFTCWLVVDESNTTASRLYQKLGFRHWAQTHATLYPGRIMGLSHRRYRECVRST